MFITEVTLKHFRKFEALQLDLRGSLVLVTGANGSGKSSLLEALYFSSALRSFRTHVPKELIAFDAQAAVVRVGIGSNEIVTEHEVQVGISPARRLVKIDNKPLTSYKEMTDYHRVIAVTEDALELIRGAPEVRRLFVDQAVLLKSPAFLSTLRTYRHIVDQRNKLLQQGTLTQGDSYAVWTEQLLEHSAIIQEARHALLRELAAKTNVLIQEWFPSLGAVSLSYAPKRSVTTPTFAGLLAQFPSLPELEKLYKRTLFGAHLDDIFIEFLGSSSRSFASRGQQKLLVLLIRAAQVLLLKEQGSIPIVLLDDFVGDLDQQRAMQLLHLLRSLKVQLIVTLPTIESAVENSIAAVADKHIKLTN